MEVASIFFHLDEAVGLQGRNYDYIAGVMRKTKREGFQFSFGLKELEQPCSARSTPKFPSIEISKQMHASQRKNYNLHGDSEPTQIRRSPWDLFQDIGGGVDLLQRKQERSGQRQGHTVAAYNDTSSVDSKDNKSVKSTKSLGERFLKQSRRLQFEKQTKGSKGKRQKHSSSLANILELRMDSSSPTFKRLEELRNVKATPFTLGKHPQAIQEKGEQRDTLKLDSPFFEGTQNLQFRETKKMAQAFDRSRLGESQREKSRLFKNFLHRPRPTLRLGTRPNNNDRIESISRKFDSPL